MKNKRPLYFVFSKHREKNRMDPKPLKILSSRSSEHNQSGLYISHLPIFLILQKHSQNVHLKTKYPAQDKTEAVL